MRIDKLSMEDISSKLPKEIFMNIVEEIKEKIATGKHKGVKISVRYNKDLYIFSWMTNRIWK